MTMTRRILDWIEDLHDRLLPTTYEYNMLFFVYWPAFCLSLVFVLLLIRVIGSL